MARTNLVLLILFLQTLTAFGQTPNDTLIGIVDQELIKINKNTGSIVNFVPVTGVPAGGNTYKLTWCEPNQCFYTLTQGYPAVLAQIDANGVFTTLGTLTISPGTLFMCEGISFNRFDGELYVSGSLDGDPNSSPADFYSETLLRVDIPTLTTTVVGTFTAPAPVVSEADAITFDDNGMLYFYDGQPGQYNRIFMQDLTFSSAPALIYNSSYDPVRDLTVKGNDLFFSLDRVLNKINIPTLVFSSVGTMFTAADFNGQFMFGITWKVGCPTETVFGNDTTICSGQSLVLSPSVTGTSYLWQDGSTNPTMDASAGGIYSVDITNGSCSYSDTITVTVEAPPVVDLGNDTTLCAGETLILDASSVIGSLEWQDGSSATSFTVSQSGTYWLSATNLCGTDVDSIDVTYFAGLNIDLGNDTSICTGASLVLDATSGADSYTWIDGSTNATFNATMPGIYWVEAALNGCVYSDTILIDQGNVPSVELGADLLICIGESALLSSNNTNAAFEWSNGSSEPSILTNGDGLYWVTVINACGVSSDSIFVESEECFCELYFPNSFTPNGDAFNGQFGPIYDCPVHDYTFEIYNRWGQLIFETNNPEIQWDGTYKGIPVQLGIYSYKIIYSTDEIIGKTLLGHVSVLR